MKRTVSILLAAVLLCLPPTPVLRPAAAAAAVQTAVGCAAAQGCAAGGGSAGFFKSNVTRLLTALIMFFELIRNKTERPQQEDGDASLITDAFTDKARYLPGENRY